MTKNEEFSKTFWSMGFMREDNRHKKFTVNQKPKRKIEDILH